MAAQLIYAVVAVGLSLLAGELLKKKEKSQIDDRPTTLATRGSFIPLLKGKRRIGLLFAWAGNRVKLAVKQGKKKWYKSREKVDTYFEDGWHILCLGPADGIYEIEEAGNPIFQGIINRTTHPSGSLVTIGQDLSFYVYWGEKTQPGCAPLKNSIDLDSNWPGICYVYWVGKNLGGTPQWSQMTYVVETKPQSTILTGSTGYPGSAIGVARTYPIIGVWRQLTTGRFDGLLRTIFMTEYDASEPGVSAFDAGVVTIANNVGIGVDVTARGGGGSLRSNSRTLAQEQSATHPTTTFDGTWEIEVDPGASGSEVVVYWDQLGSSFFYDPYLYPDTPDASGDIEVEGVAEDAGWNPAHIIAELLFEEWPHGIAADQSEWDLDSLEALGVLFSDSGEALRCSFIAQNGQDARGALAAIMQDLGIFVAINMETGLLTFVSIREPSGDVLTVPDSAILEEIEQEIQHGERTSDRVVFTFPDASLAFRDATISVDDDGQAARLEFFQNRSVQLTTTVNFKTAAKIVERRSMEELAGIYETRIELGREARRLIPGTPLIISGLDELQRVIATEHDVESGAVTVTAWNDFYGVSPTNFILSTPAPAVPEGTVPDIISAILEVPEILLNESQITIIPMTVRANSNITGHIIYTGATDSTLTQLDVEGSVMTGGRISADSNDLYYQEDGPIFAIGGSDVGTVEDLTATPALWRDGRQLAVFVAADGTQEIAFVRNITSLGAGLYQMKGVIRARYDTQLVTLNSNNPVFIFQDDDANLMVSEDAAQDATLYMQAQPVGAQILSLVDVEIVEAPIYGKGVRPVPPRELVLDTGANSSGAGNTNWTQYGYLVTGTSADDLDLIWNYSAPLTIGAGAGLFPAGQPAGDQAPEGEFSILILDSGDTVVRSTSSPTASYTYTRTDRLADFGGSEPTLFKVSVAQTRGSALSSYLTRTFTKNV